MQNMMQQLASDPTLMQSMMNSPYMQSMTNSLSQNPELAQQVTLCNQ